MYSLTANELTSARILRDFGGELVVIEINRNSGDRIADIRFPSLVQAASYVDLDDLASYTSMTAPPYRFNERVTVRFCYSAYERDADEANGYDPFSSKTRSQQYTSAMIHRRYVETHPE